ncbi:MAG: DUF3808 domain-containing protein [Blastocatellia bacterium]|nr:DUF3808 domain-containing protein [Blastocatellia bacterium]
MKRLVSTLLVPTAAALLLFAPTPLWGQTPTARTAADAVPASESTFTKLRQAGFESLYNLDYAGARKAFSAMTEMAPELPAGYLYLANAQWMEKLNQSRRLQTNLYGSDSFYAESKEQFDTKFDTEFRKLIDTAIKKAELKLKTNSKDVEALYYLGAAHGALAGYETTVTRSFFSALKHGNKSVDCHENVLKLDPQFTDANMTIGLYNYVVGSLPLPVKIIAAVGGFTGSKKRGFELLRKVTEEGRLAQDDARVLLIALNKREKKYSDALKDLQELSRKYPANYLIKLESADTMVRSGKAADSLPLFASLVEDPKTSEIRDLIEYQFGESLFSQQEFEKAQDHFAQVASLKKAHPDLISLSLLRLGQIADAANRRETALEKYKEVLARENVFDSHDQAKQFSKNRFASVKPIASQPTGNEE